MSTLDHTLKAEPLAVRRLEVITGTGRRRRFSDDDKARIVEETLVAGAVVSEVARRHGLTPQQVFTWRRQMRSTVAAGSEGAPSFVPAVVETSHRRVRHGRGEARVRRAGVVDAVITPELSNWRSMALRCGSGAALKPRWLRR